MPLSQPRTQQTIIEITSQMIIIKSIEHSCCISIIAIKSNYLNYCIQSRFPLHLKFFVRDYKLIEFLSESKKNSSTLFCIWWKWRKSIKKNNKFKFCDKESNSCMMAILHVDFFSFIFSVNQIYFEYNIKTTNAIHAYIQV